MKENEAHLSAFTRYVFFTKQEKQKELGFIFNGNYEIREVIKKFLSQASNNEKLYLKKLEKHINIEQLIEQLLISGEVMLEKKFNTAQTSFLGYIEVDTKTFAVKKYDGVYFYVQYEGTPHERILYKSQIEHIKMNALFPVLLSSHYSYADKLYLMILRQCSTVEIEDFKRRFFTAFQNNFIQLLKLNYFQDAMVEAKKVEAKKVEAKKVKSEYKDLSYNDKVNKLHEIYHKSVIIDSAIKNILVEHWHMSTALHKAIGNPFPIIEQLLIDGFFMCKKNPYEQLERSRLTSYFINNECMWVVDKGSKSEYTVREKDIIVISAFLELQDFVNNDCFSYADMLFTMANEGCTSNELKDAKEKYLKTFSSKIEQVFAKYFPDTIQIEKQKSTGEKQHSTLDIDVVAELEKILHEQCNWHITDKNLTDIGKVLINDKPTIDFHKNFEFPNSASVEKNNYCLFCGNPKKLVGGKNNSTLSCRCTDAKHALLIEEKIRAMKESIEQLKKQYPEEKYKLINNKILLKKL